MGIVMELLAGGELFNRIVEKGCFTEAEAASLFAQIILSMEYLHSLNIVHRDVAPEVLTWYDDDENGTSYGKGSDLWSLGVLLYVILSGCSPFSADEEEELLQQVAEAKFVFFENEWKGISDEAKDLIKKLVVVDPEERYTMQDVLTHPWLQAAVVKARSELATKAANGPSGNFTATSKPNEEGQTAACNCVIS